MNNNRNRGNNFERHLVKILRPYFPKIATSRSESKALDNQGCDFVGTPGFTFQAKTLSRIPNYHKILEKIKLERPIIIHRYTKKSERGLFINQGEYVIMKLEDFIELCLKKESKEYVPPNEQQEQS